MIGIAELWLAILLSSVLVFLASSAIHMASPWHKGDYPAPPRERDLLDAMRPFALPPGDYMMPRATSMAEMKSPEYIEKVTRGPVVLMTVFPNGPSRMGGTFVKWFLFLLLVSLVAAALAGTTLSSAASSAQIFHLVFIATFASYALALWPLSIWYHRAWSITLKSTVDAAIYAAITAGVFVWLWPR